jgi:hypothetical protein
MAATVRFTRGNLAQRVAVRVGSGAILYRYSVGFAVLLVIAPGCARPASERFGRNFGLAML